MDIFVGALAGLLIGAGTVYIWLQRQLSEKRQRLAALEAQYGHVPSWWVRAISRQ